MSTITRTYTFTDGTTAYGSQVESEISNIVTAWNNHDAGSSQWTTLSVSGNASIAGTLGVTSTSSFTGAATFSGNVLAAFLGYRKPNLIFISTTVVDVENNTGTANQTTIIFTDGSIRSVTEDTSSTNEYRRFDITAAANFTSGTEDSGIRSGITEATNTWYAIYAVKSQINTANFVLAGDTTLPLQANYSTLNSRYGTNGWVYLGMIRNGDNDGATGDILNFVMSNGFTKFINIAATSSMNGTALAANTTTTGLTYTYSAGTGTANIPNHIKVGLIGFHTDPGSSSASFIIGNSTADFSSIGFSSAVVSVTKATHLCQLSSDLTVTSGASGTQNIVLSGFIDPLLSAGINPIL